MAAPGESPARVTAAMRGSLLCRVWPQADADRNFCVVVAGHHPVDDRAVAIFLARLSKWTTVLAGWRERSNHGRGCRP